MGDGEAMAAMPEPIKKRMEHSSGEEQIKLEFESRSSAIQQEYADLMEDARQHSQDWKLAGKSADRRDLNAELKKLKKVIAGSGRKVGADDPQHSSIDPVRRRLEQGRLLLRSAIMGVEDALRTEKQWTQVSIEGDETFPRAYMVAKYYLDASRMEFQEESLRAYMQEVQRAGTLEIDEIWLMSPMLQLNLLQRIRETVEKSNEKPVDDASAQLEKLSATLVRVQKASWKNIFQALSVTEAILREDPAGAYERMDFRSCDSYRAAVQELSRFCHRSEDEIARIAVKMARAGLSRFPAGSRRSLRHGHVGYYLVDKGRVYLEKEIEYRPQGMAFVRAVLLEAPALFYFLGVEFCIFAILLFILSGIRVGIPFISATCSSADGLFARNTERVPDHCGGADAADFQESGGRPGAQSGNSLLGKCGC